MEEFILSLHSINPLLVYAAVFVIAFVENVFPPSPSDVVVVFAGALVSLSQIGFVETLLAASFGSAIGFIVMYKIGDWFGDRILEQGRLKFVSIQGVRKVESWFRRYGYWLIVANRFFAGTRAIVSFCAGMSELDLVRTTVLSFISACAWNSILLTSGYHLGNNWHRIGFYLRTYSEIVTAVIIIVVVVWVVRYFLRKKNRVESG